MRFSPIPVSRRHWTVCFNVAVTPKAKRRWFVGFAHVVMLEKASVMGSSS